MPDNLMLIVVTAICTTAIIASAWWGCHRTTSAHVQRKHQAKEDSTRINHANVVINEKSERIREVTKNLRDKAAGA